MIFGRPTNLWIAVTSGLFNLAVLFQFHGFMPDANQIAGVNFVIIAIVALIANTSTGSGPSVLAGKPEKR